MNDTGTATSYSEKDLVEMLKGDLKFYIDFYGSTHPMTLSVKNRLCELTGLRVVK